MKYASFDGYAIELGMDIMTMAAAMKELSRKYPEMTVDSAPRMLVVAWPRSLGLGQVEIHADGQCQVVEVSPKRAPTAVFVPPGAVARFCPSKPDRPGVAVAVSPSGDFSQARGSASPVLPPHMPRSTDNPEQAASRAWLFSEPTGSSSLALAHVLTGVPEIMEDRDFPAPTDPADFARCHRFFQCVPTARAKLDQMLAISPAWAALATAWDELEALYEQERPSGRCPSLYARMSELIQPPTRSRPSP